MASDEMFLARVILTTAADCDKKCYIYLQTKWLENQVELVLQETAEGKCYQAQIPHEAIRESAKDLEISYEQFFQECRSALTTNLAYLGFEYEIDTDEKLFKLVKKGDIDVQYLDVELKALKHNYQLLDTALNLIEDLQSVLLQNQEGDMKTDKEYHETVNALQKCLDEKCELEDVLLRKFVVVLNEKKKKITQLQEKLGITTNIDDDSDTDVGEEVRRADSQSNRNRKRSITPTDLTLDTTPSTSRQKLSAKKVKSTTPRKVIEVMDESTDEEEYWANTCDLNSSITTRSPVVNNEHEDIEETSASSEI